MPYERSAWPLSLSQLVERCKQDKIKCSEEKNKLITLEATFKNTSRETILASTSLHTVIVALTINSRREKVTRP